MYIYIYIYIFKERERERLYTHMYKDMCACLELAPNTKKRHH